MTVRRLIAGALASVVLLAAIYLAVSWVVVNEALVAEANEFDHVPEELGLAYEDVSFHPRGDDSITLRGWWLPAEGGDAPRGIVIWVHGLDSTRASRLPFLAELVKRGFDVLTFDLRGHGQSDKALMGAGQHEQADVRGAIDYVLEQRGATPGRVFLIGSSFGAAIALLAGVGEAAVGGVYADSSFATLSDMITEEVAKRTVLPPLGASLLKPGLVLMGKLTKGIDIEAVRPVDAARRYPYPIGLAHCSTDERIPVQHSEQIRAQAPIGSAYASYVCAHAEGYEADPEAYTAHVLDYLQERLSTTPALVSTQ